MNDRTIMKQYKEAQALGGWFGYTSGFVCPPHIECNDCPAADACDYLSQYGNREAYLRNYKAWYDRNQKEVEQCY